MLYQLFQSARNETEFNELLHLTFTEHERDMMLERWRIDPGRIHMREKAVQV